MTQLSFTKETAPAVENKTKFQTIRNGKHQFKVGEKLQLYKGRYAPGERIKMYDAICLSAQDIHINVSTALEPYGSIGIFIDDVPMLASETHDFIADDGFEKYEQFVKYLKTKDGKPYEGQLIKWGVEFDKLEIGKTYTSSNGAIVLIESYQAECEWFTGKIMDGSDAQLIFSPRWFEPNGKSYLHETSDLKWQVAP